MIKTPDIESSSTSTYDAKAEYNEENEKKVFSIEMLLTMQEIRKTTESVRILIDIARMDMMEKKRKREASLGVLSTIYEKYRNLLVRRK